MAELTHLIYTSVPFGYNATDLNSILMDARRINIRNEVTGALICRRDIYMQYLEGPAAVVKATYERIKNDDRHVEVALRCEGVMDTRLFANWAMLHDPAQSLIWTMEDVDDGALERANALDYLLMFKALASKVGAG